MFRQGRSRCWLEGRGRLPGPCDMEGMGKSVSYKETTVNKDAGLGWPGRSQTRRNCRLARPGKKPDRKKPGEQQEQQQIRRRLDCGHHRLQAAEPRGKRGRRSGERRRGLTPAVLEGAGPGGDQGAGPLRGLGPTR